MLKEIVNALKSHNQLTDCINLFDQMSKNNLWMCESSLKALVDKNKQIEIKDELYERDIQVNKAERKIRKKIMLHLSADNLKDVPFCLILMSVVKDAERIGDYCKNLFGASELLAAGSDADSHIDEIGKIGKSILKTFENTRKSFDDSDQELARDVMNEERNIGERCDSLLIKLANETELITNKAVCYTLFTRFLKRISAHLSNIASTVIMPLHKIDYYDEPTKS